LLRRASAFSALEELQSVSHQAKNRKAEIHEFKNFTQPHMTSPPVPMQAAPAG
jgi:hypothetical protein